MTRLNSPLARISGLAVLTLSACSTTPPAAPPASTPPTPPLPERVSTDILPDELWLCPLMKVSNAPQPTDGLAIVDYQKTVPVNGVPVAMAPVDKGCLSSGFGPRNGRVHKGIDLHNASPVDVYAGADGAIKEISYRKGYGNMIVIDHGNEVFTRYAHLDSFARGLKVGDLVNLGETIGVMGTTADFPVPRHLHYEVLTGTWGAQAGSFALTPIDIFAR